MKARLQEEIYRSERYKYPLSLIMIDLDDFKTVNDNYGHVVGDRVLKAFSELLLDMIRASDIVGRFGGEEFLIILPQTACLDAAAAAERIRKEVAVVSVPDRSPTGQGLSVHDQHRRLFLAVQQPEMRRDHQPGRRSLYRAKKEGKNKVVVVFIR